MRAAATQLHCAEATQDFIFTCKAILSLLVVNALIWRLNPQVTEK